LSIQSHAGDDFINVDLMPSATVHPWLTVFALQAEGGQVERLIVAFDSLPAEDFRRLRVFLRWQAEISDGNDDPA
jgi:toxin CptA